MCMQAHKKCHLINITIVASLRGCGGFERLSNYQIENKDIHQKLENKESKD